MNKTVTLFMLSALLCIMNLDSARGSDGSDDYGDYSQTDPTDDIVDDDPVAVCKLGELRYDTKSESANETQKYEEGDEIVLKCPVCGTGFRVPKVNWLKNNLPPSKWITTNGHEFIDSEYKLKIKKCEQNDTGNYTCTVDDLNGNVFSHLYEVEVKKRLLPSQFITELPSNATVKIGDSFSFKCPVADSSLTVHWYHNMNSSHQETPLNASEGVKPEELKFSNVTFDDAGRYACLVEDGRGKSAKAIVYLNVTDASWYSEQWFYWMLVSILGVVLVVSAVIFSYQKSKNARKFTPGNEMTETTTQSRRK